MPDSGSGAGATAAPSVKADRGSAADRRARARRRRAADTRRRAAAERRRHAAALDAARARERAAEDARPRTAPAALPAVHVVAGQPTDTQLRLAGLVLTVLAIASLGLLVPMRRRWSL